MRRTDELRKEQMNKTDEEITVKKCSEPSEKLQIIQTAQKVNPSSFIKLKYVVHKPEIKKNTKSTYSDTYAYLTRNLG
ncbi:MAG: hypothetical protein WBP33_17520 [Saprospiraceae bacterium]